MIRFETKPATTPASTEPFLVLRLAVATLLIPLLSGVATAHPSGGSGATAHLIIDGIRYLTLAFLVYLAFSFSRRVLYPRIRGYFSQ